METSNRAAELGINKLAEISAGNLADSLSTIKQDIDTYLNNYNEYVSKSYLEKTKINETINSFENK